MKFAKLQQEDRRLTVLRVLSEVPGYTCNVYVLKTALGAVGHVVSTDVLLTELDWLHEQGLVERESGAVVVARITTRGKDAAIGQTTVTGVKRPEPD